MDKKNSIYFEIGFATALSDGLIDDCKLKKAHRRNEWIRGFHEGSEQMIDKRMSATEKSTGLSAIKKLKQNCF